MVPREGNELGRTDWCEVGRMGEQDKPLAPVVLKGAHSMRGLRLKIGRRLIEAWQNGRWHGNIGHKGNPWILSGRGLKLNFAREEPLEC
jgi:hypothetical protein